MTPLAFFERMAPLVAPLLEATFERRDLCILATRVAIETARYFGVDASPLPVKVAVYNAAFARHVADGFAAADPRSFEDGSWSVGVGYGKPEAPGRWDGHLIAVADGCFGDFAIQQAERPQYNIRTGAAVVRAYREAPMWMAIEQESGTVIEYARITSTAWRRAPDWTDEQRRRPVVSKLIRTLRARA